LVGTMPPMSRERSRVRGISSKEQGSPLAPNHVAVVATIEVVVEPSAPVFHLDGPDLHIPVASAQVHRLIPGDLIHRSNGHQITGLRSRDDERMPAKGSQRGGVQVVEMSVRE